MSAFKGLFLIVEVLADAFADADALEFEHTQGDAVDLNYDVGPLLFSPLRLTSSAIAKSF